MLALSGLAGCAGLSAALTTATALRRAGYQNARVNVSTGTNLPPDGVVRVSFTAGPAGSDQTDAVAAEHIVWDTYAARLGAVVIMTTSGGCVGPVCGTQSSQTSPVTYARLRARFGPRPAGLDATGPTAGLRVPVWFVAAAAALVLAVIVIPVLTRRRGPPPAAAGPTWPASPAS